MFLTGIADEAGVSLETQIRATKALGWSSLEARQAGVAGFAPANIHDLPDAAFELLVEQLGRAGVRVDCFASAIGNWGKKIDEPFESSLAEARRAIPRMRRLGTRLIRVMSFAIREQEDQMENQEFISHPRPFLHHGASSSFSLYPTPLTGIRALCKGGNLFRKRAMWTSIVRVVPK